MISHVLLDLLLNQPRLDVTHVFFDIDRALLYLSLEEILSQLLQEVVHGLRGVLSDAVVARMKKIRVHGVLHVGLSLLVGMLRLMSSISLLVCKLTSLVLATIFLEIDLVNVNAKYVLQRCARHLLIWRGTARRKLTKRVEPTVVEVLLKEISPLLAKYRRPLPQDVLKQ